METPKPKPPVSVPPKEVVEAAAERVVREKKPFERPTHLTQKLGHVNPGLAALRDSLPQSRRDNRRIVPKAQKQR